MPLKVALAYAALAWMWILVSDGLLDRLPLEPGVRRWVNSSKGLLFVAVTALLLYGLLRGWAMRMEQAHRERLRAEMAFRAVVEASPAAVFVEVDGRYAFANRGLNRLLGLPDTVSLIGREVDTHFPASIWAPLAGRVGDGSGGGQGMRPVEGVARRADRTAVSVELTAVSLEHEGRPGLLVHARDISMRVAVEAARRAEQELLQAVLRSTTDVVYVKDAECRYLLINDAGARLLGKSVDEILGRRNADLLPEAVAAALEAADRQVMESGRRCEFELPIVLGSKQRYFRISKASLLDPSGRLKGVVGVARDRTEEVAAEASLRRMSGMFLRLQDEERRSIARELHDTTAQSLVAVSLGLSEATRAAEEGGEGLMEALEECRGLVETCTRDVRTLSYGLHPPMLDEMGLGAALEEYVKEFGRRSGLRLEFECACAMGRLALDVETALFRVAQEALLNVHRHSGSQRARVEVRETDGHVELEVRDSGKGIPQDRLEQMRAGGVVGVGMSGMRERLRQLGGELSIASDSAGTTLVARVPRLREGEEAGGDDGVVRAFRWV